MKNGQVFNFETLPPPSARLPEFKVPRQVIPTPVDERGLVNVDELIDTVKDTVQPWYEWSGPVDVHHFYWEAAKYPYIYSAGEANPGAFRNLPIHKGLVFRSFHGWLELVTIPPEPPEPEVMSYRNEAWDVARSLFTMARATIQTERKGQRRRKLLEENPHILKQGYTGKDPIGEAYMDYVFERNFRGVEFQMERNELIPIEHRLISVTNSPEQIARDLGKLIMPVRPGSVNLVPTLRAA